jgi:transposase-like protein
MAEETWEEKYKKEHKLRQEAETETILVKGIGMNSPEMKAAKQEIQRLKKELCEVRNDNRQLSHQIENQVDRLRKAALLMMSTDTIAYIAGLFDGEGCVTCNKSKN